MNESDHDLLISMKSEFGTKLDRVISDVKELKDNVADRVTSLELEKFNKADALRILDEYNKNQGALTARVSTLETDKIPALQNWRWYVIGITVASMFIFEILLQVYFHKGF